MCALIRASPASLLHSSLGLAALRAGQDLFILSLIFRKVRCFGGRRAGDFGGDFLARLRRLKFKKTVRECPQKLETNYPVTKKSPPSVACLSRDGSFSLIGGGGEFLFFGFVYSRASHTLPPLIKYLLGCEARHHATPPASRAPPTCSPTWACPHRGAGQEVSRALTRTPFIPPCLLSSVAPIFSKACVLSLGLGVCVRRPPRARHAGGGAAGDDEQRAEAQRQAHDGDARDQSGVEQETRRVEAQTCAPRPSLLMSLLFAPSPKLPPSSLYTVTLFERPCAPSCFIVAAVSRGAACTGRELLSTPPRATPAVNREPSILRTNSSRGEFGRTLAFERPLKKEICSPSNFKKLPLLLKRKQARFPRRQHYQSANARERQGARFSNVSHLFPTSLSHPNSPCLKRHAD